MSKHQETVAVELSLTADEQKALNHEFSEPYGHDIRTGILGKLRAALQQPEDNKQVGGEFKAALENIVSQPHEPPVVSDWRRQFELVRNIALAALQPPNPQHPAPEAVCICGHTAHWHGNQGTGPCEDSPDCGCGSFSGGAK
jgi:hypothetical protein